MYMVETLSIVVRRKYNIEMDFLLNKAELSITEHEKIMVSIYLDRDTLNFRM